jgi:hypothetical protein
MQIGPFAGPIYTIILIVDCVFFIFLEWWMPREDLDFVKNHWDQANYIQVCNHRSSFRAPELMNISLCSLLGKREDSFEDESKEVVKTFF